MKIFFLSAVLVLLVGCGHGKGRLAHNLPVPTTKTVRTYVQMQAKLKKIQKPLRGIRLSTQKKYFRREIDTIINETRKYSREVRRFEKKHLLRKKKKEKKIKLKSIDEVKNETPLKYY